LADGRWGGGTPGLQESLTLVGRWNMGGRHPWIKGEFDSSWQMEDGGDAPLDFWRARL